MKQPPPHSAVTDAFFKAPPVRLPLKASGQSTFWRGTLLSLGLVLAATCGVATAQTVISSGQIITASGSYKIPEGVGIATFTVTGSGGGGGGKANQVSVNGGGNGGNGATVSNTLGSAGGLVFSVSAGSGGNAGQNGGACGTSGGNGSMSEAHASGVLTIRAAGGAGGGAACTSGGSTTAGSNGAPGSCGSPSAPENEAGCFAFPSNNGGKGATHYPQNTSASAGGAGSVTVSWPMQSQNITCPSLPRLSVLGTSTTLTASSSLAGASLGYSGGTPGVCSISGNQLTPIGWGTCNYTVDAAGNGTTNSATKICTASVALDYAISGSVSGLEGAGAKATLFNNGTPIAQAGNAQAWTAEITQGNYNLTATAPGHTCPVSNGSGSLTGAPPQAATGVAVSCTPNAQHVVSGTVTGLAGGQIASVSDGITAQTGSTFSFTVTHGASYSLTASAPHHSCTSATGGPITASVANLQIACQPLKYTLGGSVTGLATGTTANVSLNGGAGQLITDGSFSFTDLPYARIYSVTATAAGYSCTPTTVAISGDVTDAVVACTANQYTLGYAVSGLTTGNTLVLSLGNVDTTHTADGNGSYTNALAHGQAYALTVKAQPAGQTCTVSANGSGSSAAADVTGITVQCQSATYDLTGAAQPAIGGNVTCSPASVNHGQAASCTAQAQPGWRFKAFDAASACTLTSGALGSTCEIDDMQANRTVTAQFEPYLAGTTVPASGTGGPASASFTGGGDTCRFDSASSAFVAAPARLPSGQTLPHGMLAFKLIGCDASPVTMRVTWPTAVQGLTKFGKATAGAAQSTHFVPTGLVVSGATTTFTVQDGQQGDDDWTVNGEIVDPVGPTLPMDAPVPGDNLTPVPTLGQWALVLLSLLAGAVGLGALRRRIA